jgi:hypothetical protein
MKENDRQEILLRVLCRGVPNSSAISRDLQKGRHSTAAAMSFSLANVRETCRRPALTSVVCFNFIPYKDAASFTETH